MSAVAAPEDVTDGLRGLRRLVSPYGLVSHTRRIPAREGEPDFAVHLAHIGAPSRALPHLGGVDPREDTGNADGAGTGLDAERAELVAVAEALERYSVAAWDPADMVVAPETALREEHVSPSRWASCSPTELARPGCHLAPYDPAVPIRWVRGWSLTHRRAVLVPAITVYLHMPYQTSSERFTRGVTTGAAVHTDVRQAALNGLLEVVERDAIALVWLQRLRLPEVVVDPAVLDAPTAEHHRVGTATDLRLRVLDATTDLGVPVLYGVQLADADPHLAQVVAATCDIDPRAALRKLHRELASLRVALTGYLAAHAGRAPAPDRVSVVGGAVHNAVRERRGVFDFLLDGPRATRRLDDLPTVPAAADALDTVVGRLAARGAEVVVVDVTTDEARQVGMTAVKVLVPEALPVSFVHAERYLATPRLYTAPVAMGHPSAAEADLNPEHQPFA